MVAEAGAGAGSVEAGAVEAGAVRAHAETKSGVVRGAAIGAAAALATGLAAHGDAEVDAEAHADAEVNADAYAMAGADAEVTADACAEGALATAGIANRGRQWPRWLLFAAVAVAVMVAGLDPLPLPERFPQQDKLHHLLGFAALYASARIAFPRMHMGRLVAACLAAALLIELAQGQFLPHRTASLADMLANTAGVALGAACVWLWRRRSPAL